jgi:hypothetical protein
MAMERISAMSFQSTCRLPQATIRPSRLSSTITA